MTYVLEKGYYQNKNGELVHDPNTWAIIVYSRKSYNSALKFFNECIVNSVDQHFDLFDENWVISDMYLKSEKFQSYPEWMINININKGIVPSFEIHTLLNINNVPTRNVFKIIDLTKQTTIYENKNVACVELTNT